jgi:hypothetical protein
MFKGRVQTGEAGKSESTECTLWPNNPAVVKCNPTASDCQISASVESMAVGINDFVQKYWPLQPVL